MSNGMLLILAVLTCMGPLSVLFLSVVVLGVFLVRRRPARQIRTPIAQLTDEEIESLKKGLCPDCGGKLLYGQATGAMISAVCDNCKHVFETSRHPDAADYSHRV